MKQENSAWVQERNQQQAQTTVNWRFTSQDARVKAIAELLVIFNLYSIPKS